MPRDHYSGCLILFGRYTYPMEKLDNQLIQVEHLRELIGLKVRHQGSQWEIIEILEDGPALVLRDCEMHTVIQADQHGEAHRRVPTTITIPLFDQDGNDLNPALLNLDLTNLA
jgi:hypothetical protein